MAGRPKKNAPIDTYGRKLTKGDTCLFWNDDPKNRVIYKFYDMYYREVEHKYISIDENDDNDLSWWKHCELLI